MNKILTILFSLSFMSMHAQNSFDYLSLSRKACSDTEGQYRYYISEDLEGDASSSTRLVFVDTNPGAGWNHSCKYLYYSFPSSSIEGKDYTLNIVDSICPPLDMKMKRLDKTSSVYKAPGNTFTPEIHPMRDNLIAKKTYALILSGGVDPISNEERYWNDCSYIYKVLRNKYQIPKENIVVLMSDGRSDGKDMNPSNGGDFISSPIDLDGDYRPDIDNSAIKSNVVNALNAFASKLTPNDNFFLYVADHGGYDKGGDPYISLWDGGRIYDRELAALLDGINVKYMNVVLGQCYSGGFIKALEKTNRVITTACAADELSYGSADGEHDEFLYHWTTAINRYGKDGRLVKSDYDNDGHISMFEAFVYAAARDMYTNGKFPYAQETPQISSPAGIVMDELAFDRLPKDTVDLFICDYKGDTGIRPYDRNFVYWSSPDIWGRFNDDGIEHQEAENIRFTEDNDVCYIYARIRNRGTKPYVYDSNNPMFVSFYWAKSSFAISEKKWRGYIDSNDENGGYIGRARIKGTINPGESQIVKVKWQAQNDAYDDLIGYENFHACLLANISNSTSIMPDIVEDTTNIVKIWETNKVAQRNKILMHKGGLLKNARIELGEIAGNKDNLSIQVVDLSKENVQVKKEISVGLSPALFQSLKQKDFPGTDINYNNNPNNELLLTSEKSRIEGISLKKGNKDYLDFGCSFVADRPIYETYVCNVNLALTDQYGNYLGGESFEIVNDRRDKIDLTTSVSTNADGKNVLKVTDVSEGVTYEWYDSDGNYIGSGSSISVPANFSEKQYTVKVKSETDGAVNYETVTVPKSGVISSVDTACKDGMKVEFSSPVRSNTTLQVASPTSVSPVKNYPVEQGSSSYMVSIPNMEHGVYQITLLESGNIIDTRKAIK